MSEDQSKVCSFSFKKRKSNAIRRKNSSSSEEETVITRNEKKISSGLLSAKTVINRFVIFEIFYSKNFPVSAGSSNQRKSKGRQLSTARTRK